MKRPRILSIDEIVNSPYSKQMEYRQVYHHNGCTIVKNAQDFLYKFMHPSTPYLITDYRMGIIKRGSMHAIINLQEYTVKAGMAVFITPGTIAEPQEMSKDLELIGMGLSEERFHSIHSDSGIPFLFNGQMKSGGIQLTTEQISQALHLHSTLFHTACTHGMAQEVIDAMVLSVTRLFSHIFTMSANATAKRTADISVFNRFLHLVDMHSREQRRLAFYADRMCITESYLTTVIKQSSGVTAKEWIDKAVITMAKVALRHSDRQITQISDDLHFPTVSFFCKFFKRIEGCTPMEYRTAGYDNK